MGPFSFTVFTPTYNRSATLGRVYECLKAQTFRNFEWLIIDDGSTDETRELVESWLRDPASDFPIQYLFQENSHKKVAHNRAVKEAKGELLLVFDSDDTCIPRALEQFWSHWNGIPKQQREQFSGVCGLCMDETGKVVGDRFPANGYIDSDSLEMKYRYRVLGEKWGVMRTDVLRAFPFREDIPGLVPESTVWDAIGRHYRTRFFNEALRIYHQDFPGLIARKGEVVDARKNAPGAAYSKKFYLDNNIAFFWYAPSEFILEAARLTRFWLHSPEYLRQRMEYWPRSRMGKVLAIIGSPLGFGMFLIDHAHLYRRRHRKNLP